MEKNLEKALDCYLKSSESGSPVALFNVGLYYYEGKGVPVNVKKAKEYFKLSAEKDLKEGK